MTLITHIAVRFKDGGKALYQSPVELDLNMDIEEQLIGFRRASVVEIIKDTKQRPQALLIGIQGKKK